MGNEKLNKKRRKMVSEELNTKRWKSLMRTILLDGGICTPGSKKTVEVLGMQEHFDMNYPVISCSARKLNTNFMIAEAAWILSGSNDVNYPMQYMKKYGNWSDNGVIMSGAYGPAIFRQMSYITNCLLSDPESRQAVLTIWAERPQESLDIPCTLSLQFLIRNKEIHCIANMRSSDVFLGLPYDIFVFSMIAANLSKMLNYYSGIEYELGYLTWQAGSAHIYARDSDKAIDCINSGYEKSPSIPQFTNVEKDLKHILDNPKLNWVVNYE